MRMTNRELREIMGEAAKQFVQMPAQLKLAGSGRVVDEGERRAVCFIMGVTRFLNAKGLLREGVAETVDPEFEEIDSEPETSGA